MSPGTCSSPALKSRESTQRSAKLRSRPPQGPPSGCWLGADVADVNVMQFMCFPDHKYFDVDPKNQVTCTHAAAVPAHVLHEEGSQLWARVRSFATPLPPGKKNQTSGESRERREEAASQSRGGSEGAQGDLQGTRVAFLCESVKTNKTFAGQ